jgi:hypothetical protein
MATGNELGEILTAENLRTVGQRPNDTGRSSAPAPPLSTFMVESEVHNGGTEIIPLGTGKVILDRRIAEILNHILQVDEWHGFFSCCDLSMCLLLTNTIIL